MRDFDNLVKEHSRLVMDLIRKYYRGRLRHIEEDLAQDVWIKLWTQLQKRGENKVDDFKSYLYRTVQTTLWDAIRKVEKDSTFELDPDQVGGSTESPRLEAKLELEARMKFLNEEESLMIRAHLRGFNNDEIAALLGASEGRVRNLLTRIKKKMAWGTP